MAQIKFELTIDKVVYGGDGLGRHQGKVVFAPFTVPGDRVLARVVQEKRNLLRAEALQIIEPGPGRVTPPCPHFGRCGGCHWQHIEYARQVGIKRSLLEETMNHRFPETRDLPIALKPSPKEYDYRSRARIQVRTTPSGARVGFFRMRSQEVEDIGECPLFRPSLNKALAAVRRSHAGAAALAGATEIEMACDEDTGRWEITPAESGGACLDGGASDSPLERKVGEFVYATSPSTFFQANDWLAEELVRNVTQLCSERGRESALELYAGVGLFTVPLSARFGRVMAVEGSRHAVELCARNLQSARAFNTVATRAGVLDWLRKSRPAGVTSVDALLLDPPRNGAGPEVMAAIADWHPDTVVYVSCDPQTLCRDLAALPRDRYVIDHVEGFDLFPQTFHFETVVRLRAQKRTTSPSAGGPRG